jgi:NAD(P)-dependent dehydrogenase (short-subunit alcohol dehydrogenase family)
MPAYNIFRRGMLKGTAAMTAFAVMNRAKGQAPAGQRSDTGPHELGGQPVPEPPDEKSAGPIRPGRGSTLTGKVAIVTGAARGIGRAIAVEMAANGADVVALDIAGPVSSASNAVPATPQDLAETVRQIMAHGRRGESLRADIRDIAALRAAADHVEQTYGKIDIVVADAAIQRWKPLLEMDDSDWHDVIDNNLNGTANTIRAFAPMLQAKATLDDPSRIIITASVAGLGIGTLGKHGTYGYSASKAAAISLALAACSGKESTPVSEAQKTPAQQPAEASTNPLLSASTLPFQAPQFDKIKDSDYLPAFEEGMRQHLADVRKIADNTEPATFDNTIVAMEKSGQILDRATTVFFSLVGADTNDTRKKLQADYSAKFAAHSDAIALNGKLFARIQALYDTRSQLGLDAEGVRLVEKYYDNYVRAGAKLSEADKATLKEMNAELANLGTKFSQNVQSEVNASAITVDDVKELAGLSKEQIAAAAEAAKARGLEGKYVITLLNTTGQPPLTNLANRALRQKIYEASVSRGSRGGEFDNTALVSRIMQLRADKAKLMGFANFAAYNLTNQTAKTPEAVNAMLGKLAPAAVANAKREAADLQAMIDQEQKAAGKKTFALEPWDWAFYSEKVRQAKYNFDESQLKPYFEMKNVLENGVFYAAGQEFGLTFKQRTDLPVYHDDVTVYDVFDADGSQLAIFIFDPYARAVQARRRVDELVCLAVQADRFQAGGGQPPEHPQAAGRPADAADLGRGEHHLPRVRPRAARHVRRLAVPLALGCQHRARFRRVSLAVQRAVGVRPEGVRPLREALPDRCADARRTRGQDQESQELQPGLCDERAHRRGIARYAVAHAAGRRGQAGCRRVRSQCAEEGRVHPAAGAAALPLELLPAHLGQRLRRRLLRLPVDADARFGRLRVVQGARRPDPRKRADLPRQDPLARQYGRSGEALPRFPRQGSLDRADAEGPWPQITHPGANHRRLRGLPRFCLLCASMRLAASPARDLSSRVQGFNDKDG